MYTTYHVHKHLLLRCLLYKSYKRMRNSTEVKHEWYNDFLVIMMLTSSFLSAWKISYDEASLTNCTTANDL